MAEKPEQWHLSKSVPVSIIVVLVLQAAGAVWMFSTMDSTIASNERRVSNLEAQVADVRATAQSQAVQLGRIEANIDSMKETLARIITLLERQNGS